MRYANTVTIARPAAEVFAYMTSLANLPTWQEAIVVATPTSTGPQGVGSTYSATARVMGRELDGSGEIVAWDPPRSYTLKTTSGPLLLTVTMTLTPEGTGTRVDAVSEGQARGVLRFAGPGIEAILQRQAQQDLESLKSVLEGFGNPN
ncbi:MAG TPA: SRPBCC family protein [Thermomicrobiaceae bacterium]|nr:SRPBCC family protein [Thermomicrobiaceae bacterium]